MGKSLRHRAQYSYSTNVVTPMHSREIAKLWQVDDSEPEREQARRRKRRERRQIRTQKNRVHISSSNVSPGVLLSNPNDALLVKTDPNKEPRLSPIFSSTNSRHLIESCSGHHASVSCMNLAPFAYIGSRPRDNLSSTMQPPIGPGRYALKKLGIRNNDARGFAFEERELAQLLGCVSCGRPWTTKKTPSQKMTHILRCGQKKGIKPEILRRVVHQEYTSRTSPKDNISDINHAEHDASTVMDCLVGEHRSKRIERALGDSGLKPAAWAREAILNKTTQILDPASLSPDSTFNIPSTQNFTASTLGGCHQKLDLF